MGRKKASGEGTIYKYKSGWRGQIFIDKKRVSFSGATKNEVMEAMARAKSEFYNGNWINKSDITFEIFFERWFASEVKPFVTEVTAIRYEAGFNNHILPFLGKYKVQEISKSLLQEMYGTVFGETNAQSGQAKYSHATVNALAVQLKKILQYAVNEKIIGTNPHQGLRLHKFRPSKKVEAFTSDEHKKIIKYLTDANQLDWHYYLLITTGMRFGEAAALTWEDYNVTEKTLSINKISTELHGSPAIVQRTKTDAGTRVISIAPKVSAWLDAIKKEVDNELNFRNLILPNSRYNIRTSANSNRRWRQVCEQLEIPYKSQHALRHSWGTRALETGVDIKTVSMMLGHKDVVTTMNIYQDVFQEHQEKVIVKMNDFF